MTAIFGNDETYLNYFKDQNPPAFFGFSSLNDFVEFIENIPMKIQRDTTRDRNAGWCESMSKWRGTKNMPEALELATHGWNEGVEISKEITDEFTVQHTSNKQRIYGLTGGRVNVGKMLSGNPNHMIKRTKQPGKKVVTLFIETFMSSGIEPENSIIRAATVAAISDLLEMNGYSCEIVAIVTTSINAQTGSQSAITLKSAGERLNLFDIVFALGHPSFFRRMIFAAVGSSKECANMWRSQGSPTTAFNEEHPVASNEFYIRQLALGQQDRLEWGDTLLEKTTIMLSIIKPANLDIGHLDN